MLFLISVEFHVWNFIKISQRRFSFIKRDIVYCLCNKLTVKLSFPKDNNPVGRVVYKWGQNANILIY